MRPPNRHGPRRGRANVGVPARTNVPHMVTHVGDVTVEVSALLAAVDLIASQAERERLAYERGVLAGFGRGWEQRGDYEAECRWAA